MYGDAFFFIAAIALSDFSGFCLFLLVGWVHHHLSRHQSRWSGLAIQLKAVDYHHFDGSGRGFDWHCHPGYSYDRDCSWKDVELRFQPQQSEDDFCLPLGGHLVPRLPVLLDYSAHQGDRQYPWCPEMTLLSLYPIHFLL